MNIGFDGRRQGNFMFSKFFINRPIFATVVSLIIVLAGLAALRVLPISRYPKFLRR
jgi:multidrug efflux pump subunit AcrB